MRVKIDASGKAVLPPSYIRTYSGDLSKIEALAGYLVDHTFIYTFSQDENIAVTTILNKNRILYELINLPWYDQIRNALSTKAFATEADAIKSLCAVDGPARVTKATPVSYNFYLPQTVNGGTATVYLNNKNSTGLGPAYTSVFKEDTGSFEFSILTPGSYSLHFMHDQYMIDYDIEVQYEIGELRTVKIDEFNNKCNASILAGFKSSASGTAYTYDFDYEAQTNLNGMLTTVATGLYTGPIPWKTHELEAPVNLTIDQFKKLFMDGLSHKMTSINKYRSLKDQILASVDYDFINKLQW